MFYCYDCKSSFEEPNSKSDIIKDSDGKGIAATHTNLCPNCDSDNITGDTKECRCCKEHFGRDDIYSYNYDFYCEDCLDERINHLSIDTMIEFAPKEKIEISDFIVAVLGKKLINDILKDAMCDRLNAVSLVEKRREYFDRDYEAMAMFASKYDNL